jgi:bacillithiol biosynthesis cysteine-adding enzyme BshC
VKHTELPSSSALFTDFLYHFERVKDFYRYPPETEQVAEAAAAVQVSPEHRRALVTALRKLNSESGPAVAENLDLLAKDGTVVVATGQQVGLYGGPVFTLYKALTALRLAHNLRQGGVPAVAVFWLATEDHDLDEIDHAWVFNKQTAPVRVEAVADHQPDQPVGDVEVVDAGLTALQSAVEGLPFSEEVLEWAEQAYVPGRTFREGFTRLIGRLLEPLGLIFVDPMSPAIRRLSAELFRRAMKDTPELIDALLARSHALDDAGYHAQVRVTEETSLLFLIDKNRRTVLRRSEAGYSGGGNTYSPEELLQRLDERPGDFSPNALLRPVTQDYLLPTAAYIGGPAEVAYLAQAQVLYERLLGRMPVVLPRASLTVLDSKAQRLLERYRLSIADCCETPEALRRTIAERLIPPSLEHCLAESESDIEQALEAARRELETFDPTLSQALGNTSKKMLYQFGKIRSKAGQESLKRDSRAESDAAYLARLIYPEKMPQERLFSVPAFVARYGFEFVDRTYEAIRPECCDHQVIVL